jgi:hypothetical protein
MSNYQWSLVLITFIYILIINLVKIEAKDAYYNIKISKQNGKNDLRDESKFISETIYSIVEVISKNKGTYQHKKFVNNEIKKI